MCVFNTRHSKRYIALLVAVHANKNDGANRINTKIVMLFRSGTSTFNTCRSLDYTHDNESIIFFNDLCKPMEIYIHARKKYPFTSYSTAKHPKHNKLAVTNKRKNSGPF